MQTKIENSFKAVDFMRSVRNELSELYHTDKERFHRELKKSMEDFLTNRTKAAANNSTQDSMAERTNSAVGY
jgi:hypothetical protein